MDDAVHVEVEVVELGNLVFLHHLTQAGVPLGKPAIKLGNSHPEVLVVKHLKYDFTFSEIKI